MKQHLLAAILLCGQLSGAHAKVQHTEVTNKIADERAALINALHAAEEERIKAAKEDEAQKTTLILKGRSQIEEFKKTLNDDVFKQIYTNMSKKAQQLDTLIETTQKRTEGYRMQLALCKEHIKQLEAIQIDMNKEDATPASIYENITRLRTFVDDLSKAITEISQQKTVWADGETKYLDCFKAEVAKMITQILIASKANTTLIDKVSDALDKLSKETTNASAHEEVLAQKKNIPASAVLRG